MAIMLLTIIFFAGGLIAILYSVLALLSMLKYSRAQKALPEKFSPKEGKPATIGPPIVDAYCQRARILLQSGRFDAALADCKRAIDINPQHAEANNLWKHAQEREVPPAPVVEPEAETAPAPAEAEPVVKEVKRAVKRAIPRKRVAAEPVPAEKAKEEPAVILEEAEPEKEIILEEIPSEAVPPSAEPLAAEPEEVSVAAEPVVKEEAPVAPEPDFERALKDLEPSVELEVEAEVEPVAEPETAEEAAEEVPEKEIREEEAPPVELEPEKAEPVIQLEAEAEIEPAAEPEITEEVAEEVAAARPPLPGEEEGPLIPEDKLAAPKPSRKSLLEEFEHEKLKEYEEGEAEAGDTEWTRYADKDELELAESKIDMNELPASATGLKETLTDLRQAEAFNLQGETKINKKQYSNALKDFSKALEIHPNYVDALINRGSVYAQLGRFNDALMDFNHALKFEKKDAELYNKRGEIYLQNEMHDQAIKDFTAAVVLNPMFSDAYLNRGRAYSEKGMPEEAMNDFNQAIKADSDHSFSFIDRAAPAIQVDDESASDKEEAAKLMQQGLADLESKKYEAAAKNFTQAINIAANDAEGYINRGRAYIELEKTDEAIADFKQAVLFDPLNASLYYWRAQAWKAKNDQFNMTEDLKLSCEMGYEPACLEYKKQKPTKN